MGRKVDISQAALTLRAVEADTAFVESLVCFVPSPRLWELPFPAMISLQQSNGGRQTFSKESKRFREAVLIKLHGSSLKLVGRKENLVLQIEKWQSLWNWSGVQRLFSLEEKLEIIQVN